MWSRLTLVLSTLMLSGSCGGQIAYNPTERDDLSTTRTQAAGGASSISISTAGNTSTGGATETGEATGTGGASTVDMAYCDGLLAGPNCGYVHAAIAPGEIPCALPLQSTPENAYRTVLALDCEWIPFVGVGPSDGGTANGYFIDYTPVSAMLILVGSACDALQKPGNHTLDLVVVCATFN